MDIITQIRNQIISKLNNVTNNVDSTSLVDRYVDMLIERNLGLTGNVMLANDLIKVDAKNLQIEVEPTTKRINGFRETHYRVTIYLDEFDPFGFWYATP